MKEMKLGRGGLRPHRQYDETYRRNAVQLTLQGERTVREIAADLKVPDYLLYKWRRQYAPRAGAETGEPETPAEKDAEIKRLRAEVVRLRERELILKKSLGILSETPESGMPKWKR